MVHPRAIRRSHRQRMKRRAAKLYPAKCAGKLADNLTACSCPMCGNRRKWFKERTIKEQLAIISVKSTQ